MKVFTKSILVLWIQDYDSRTIYLHKHVSNWIRIEHIKNKWEEGKREQEKKATESL